MKISTLMIPIATMMAGCAGGFVATTDGTVTTGAYVDDRGPVGIDVDLYPRAYYDGEWVYNVDGRYYRRHGSTWYRYRERPRGLEFRTYGHARHERVEQPDRGHEHHGDGDHHDHDRH